MTKFEIKKKEIEIVERMYSAIEDMQKWDMSVWDAEKGEYTIDSNADPDLVALYSGWFSKLEKMV